MKKIIYMSILLIIGITQNNFSQNISDLNGIYYQAVAIDENGKEIVGMDIAGKPLYEKAIGVRFTITKGLNGAIQWEETHTTTTDKYGLFSLIIGHGTPTGNSTYSQMSDIPWIDAEQFLKVEIASENDGNYKLVSNQQFMTVPYSFYTDDIADDAITSSKILDETILADDIANNTINLSTKVNDILPVTNGGTGNNSLTDGNILVGSGTDPISAKILASTDSNILITQTTDSIILKGQFAATEVNSNPAGTFNIGNLPAGSTYTLNAINAFVVEFGDIITASVDTNLQGCMLTAYVSQPNVIRVSIFNGTGGAVNLGTVEVRVFIVK